VLESILQKFRGIVLALMVISLSAVFVLQFGGPQAEGCSGKTQSSYAAEVYGSKITINEYRAAFSLVGGENFPPDYAKQNKLQENVLYGLVERDLLVREARKLGLSANEDDVMQKVAEDGVLHSSMSINAGPYLPPSGPRRADFKDSDGKFNKDNLKKFIQYRLRRSVEEFAREQSEETLAQAMREAVVAQVAVSPQEVWDAFVREKESVTLKYARFSPAYYKEKLEPSAAELSQFIADNQKEVDAAFERDKQRYTGLEKQVRARHILLKVDENATEEQKVAVKARAESLLARAKKGEDFATLAKANSEDQGSAKKGGDLGYNPKGRMVTAFDDAQFALAPGQISDLVLSSFGYHIIKVEAVREGDVPVDEAKREIAQKLYVTQKSDAMAKAAAAKAQADLAAGRSIDEINAELSGVPVAAADAEGKAPEADALAPQFRDTSAFGRTDAPIAGPFDGTPLVRAAFEMSKDKPLPAAPMQLGDEWIAYRLEDRVSVTREDMTAADADRIRQGLLGRKQRDVLTDYVRGLLKKAQADNAVFVDETVLQPETQDNS
jgi:peptidyl-prolyl cis-trans isomerase D